MSSWFLTFMPVFGAVAIIAVVLYMIFQWYKMHAAPGPGVPLGELEIYGRHGSTHVHLKGMAVDATNQFCSSEMTQQFKDLLCEDINKMLPDLKAEASQTEAPSEKPSETAENAEEKTVKARVEAGELKQVELETLENVKKQIQTYPFESVCRVAIIRDSGDSSFGFVSQRHLVFVFADAKRNLLSYASNEEENHFNFAFGPMTKGVIFGDMETLIEDWELPNERFKLGDFPAGTVHILVPDEPTGKTDAVEDQKKNGDTAKTDSAPKERLNIVKLLLHLPNAIYIQMHVKSLERQLTDRDNALKDMSDKLSEYAAKLDKANRAVKAFLTEGKTLDDLMPKKLDEIDVLCVIGFPTVFYAVADAFKVYPLIGVIVGLCSALFAIHRRH
jgi:hypothetical protein